MSTTSGAWRCAVVPCVTVTVTVTVSCALWQAAGHAMGRCVGQRELRRQVVVIPTAGASDEPIPNDP